MSFMKKKILAIVGSASENSSNLKLVQHISNLISDEVEIEIFDQLAQLPHFNSEQSQDNPPALISKIRQAILAADGILISSPEYVFSIPSGLKNLLEWCVATTVFTQKPACLITASASGKMGHEELKFIMKTLDAKISENTCLLISGVKGKLDADGKPLNEDLTVALLDLIRHFEMEL